VFGWLAFLNKLLRDGYITKDVYEKSLRSVKISMNSKEFETVMHLLKQVYG
jgi:ribosomal protein L25 (general stress protein Ctc)